ncbi:unnamed protein product [Gordionus sp. m RMFG-2023]|uniref:uncharacterized protein LOC135923982 isoform X2 n=1 Tax=Gordionus sp. m RMFG-2023 TaxID=3053472 RepID=UPI0030DEEFE5
MDDMTYEELLQEYITLKRELGKYDIEASDIHHLQQSDANITSSMDVFKWEYLNEDLGELELRRIALESAAKNISVKPNPKETHLKRKKEKFLKKDMNYIYNQNKSEINLNRLFDNFNLTDYSHEYLEQALNFNHNYPTEFVNQDIDHRENINSFFDINNINQTKNYNFNVADKVDYDNLVIDMDISDNDDSDLNFYNYSIFDDNNFNKQQIDSNDNFWQNINLDQLANYLKDNCDIDNLDYSTLFNIFSYYLNHIAEIENYQNSNFGNNIIYENNSFNFIKTINNFPLNQFHYDNENNIDHFKLHPQIPGLNFQNVNCYIEGDTQQTSKAYSNILSEHYPTINLIQSTTTPTEQLNLCVNDYSSIQSNTPIPYEISNNICSMAKDISANINQFNNDYYFDTSINMNYTGRTVSNTSVPNNTNKTDYENTKEIMIDKFLKEVQKWSSTLISPAKKETQNISKKFAKIDKIKSPKIKEIEKKNCDTKINEDMRSNKVTEFNQYLDKDLTIIIKQPQLIEKGEVENVVITRAKNEENKFDENFSLKYGLKDVDYKNLYKEKPILPIVAKSLPNVVKNKKTTVMVADRNMDNKFSREKMLTLKALLPKCKQKPIIIPLKRKINGNYDSDSSSSPDIPISKTSANDVRNGKNVKHGAQSSSSLFMNSPQTVPLVKTQININDELLSTRLVHREKAQKLLGVCRKVCLKNRSTFKRFKNQLTYQENNAKVLLHKKSGLEAQLLAINTKLNLADRHVTTLKNKLTELNTDYLVKKEREIKLVQMLLVNQKLCLPSSSPSRKSDTFNTNKFKIDNKIIKPTAPLIENQVNTSIKGTDKSKRLKINDKTHNKNAIKENLNIGEQQLSLASKPQCNEISHLNFKLQTLPSSDFIYQYILHLYLSNLSYTKTNHGLITHDNLAPGDNINFETSGTTILTPRRLIYNTLIGQTLKTDYAFNNETMQCPEYYYHTPLIRFKSFKLSPYFRTKAKMSLSSIAHTTSIDPNKIVCPFELRGTCKDETCSYQHIFTNLFSNDNSPPKIYSREKIECLLWNHYLSPFKIRSYKTQIDSIYELLPELRNHLAAYENEKLSLEDFLILSISSINQILKNAHPHYIQFNDLMEKLDGITYDETKLRAASLNVQKLAKISKLKEFDSINVFNGFVNPQMHEFQESHQIPKTNLRININKSRYYMNDKLLMNFQNALDLVNKLPVKSLIDVCKVTLLKGLELKFHNKRKYRKKEGCFIRLISTPENLTDKFSKQDELYKEILYSTQYNIDKKSDFLKNASDVVSNCDLEVLLDLVEHLFKKLSCQSCIKNRHNLDNHNFDINYNDILVKRIKALVKCFLVRFIEILFSPKVSDDQNDNIDDTATLWLFYLAFMLIFHDFVIESNNTNAKGQFPAENKGYDVTFKDKLNILFNHALFRAPNSIDLIILYIMYSRISMEHRSEAQNRTSLSSILNSFLESIDRSLHKLTSYGALRLLIVLVVFYRLDFVTFRDILLNEKRYPINKLSIDIPQFLFQLLISRLCITDYSLTCLYCASLLSLPQTISKSDTIGSKVNIENGLRKEIEIYNMLSHCSRYRNTNTIHNNLILKSAKDFYRQILIFNMNHSNTYSLEDLKFYLYPLSWNLHRLKCNLHDKCGAALPLTLQKVLPAFFQEAEEILEFVSSRKDLYDREFVFGKLYLFTLDYLEEKLPISSSNKFKNVSDGENSSLVASTCPIMIEERLTRIREGYKVTLSIATRTLIDVYHDICFWNLVICLIYFASRQISLVCVELKVLLKTLVSQYILFIYPLCNIRIESVPRVDESEQNFIDIIKKIISSLNIDVYEATNINAMSHGSSHILILALKLFCSSDECIYEICSNIASIFYSRHTKISV